MKPHLPHERLTLATRITIARILGIPVFVLFMIYYRMEAELGGGNVYRWLALALFIAVALSDALDGYLARSRSEVTRLGKILDPLADKALLLAAVISLCRPFPQDAIRGFPVWFALIMVSRDIVLIGGSGLVHLYCGHVDVHPRWTGKLATALTMLAIVAALSGAPALLQRAGVSLAACFVFISGLQYLIDGIQQLEHGHHEHETGHGG